MSNIVREIHTQYEALAQTRTQIDAQFDAAKALIGDRPLALLGCGSSYTIAQSGALMAKLRLNRPAEAIAAGDLLIRPALYRPLIEGACVIVLSRSGETSEAVRAVEALRALGIEFKLLTVSCVVGSTLSVMSDLAIELPWAFDASVCQTRTVTNLYYFCAQLVAKLTGDGALAAGLDLAIANGPAFMERVEPVLADIAKKPWNHGVVLGDAELQGLCDEAALTFKEICQLPSNYYHMLDVRHGPMVLVGPQTLVVILLTGHALELDLVRDAVARGAVVVTYSDEPLAVEGATNIPFGAALPDPARGLPFINILQLVTYHKSFETHADPDAPDGLSAWIKLK